MALKICNLNVTLPFSYTQGWTHASIYESITQFHYAGFSCVKAQLFSENSIKKNMATTEFVSGRWQQTGNVEESTSCILCLTFAGYIKFSVLFRNKGQCRISTGGLLNITDSNLKAALATHVMFVAEILEKTTYVEFPDKYKFYILLCNCVYNRIHPFANTSACAEYFERQGNFAALSKPDFSGVKRRKGMISLYVHSTKKNGVVNLNKESFSLMGFTKADDIETALRNIEMLIDNYK